MRFQTLLWKDYDPIDCILLIDSVHPSGSHIRQPWQTDLNSQNKRCQTQP